MKRVTHTDGWQPIATAPHSEWILLGWFYETGGGGDIDYCMYHTGAKTWYNASGKALSDAGFFAPTHWRVAPRAPQEWIDARERQGFAYKDWIEIEEAEVGQRSSPV